MRRALPALGIAIAALALGFPLAWAALSSLVPEAELYRASPVPGAVTTAHYRDLFAERDFWTPVRSSLIVAASTTATT